MMKFALLMGLGLSLGSLPAWAQGATPSPGPAATASPTSGGGSGHSNSQPCGISSPDPRASHRCPGGTVGADSVGVGSPDPGSERPTAGNPERGGVRANYAAHRNPSQPHCRGARADSASIPRIDDLGERKSCSQPAGSGPLARSFAGRGSFQLSKAGHPDAYTLG